MLFFSIFSRFLFFYLINDSSISLIFLLFYPLLIYWLTIDPYLLETV